VGVGEVKETTQLIKDFTVNVDGRDIPILEAPVKAERMWENKDDPEKSEYASSGRVD
jgi:hypothetical protein